MAPTIHFLAGLPRTGSTLLGSILAQHPRVHVTPTSPLYPLLVSLNESCNLCSVQYTYDHAAVSGKAYRGLVDAVHGDCRKPIVFDKHRGWPKHIDAIRAFINPEPRIVATIRPIPEIMASYIVLADRDPDNFIDAHLKRDGRTVTNEARAHLLWTTYLAHPYECLQTGLRDHPESILLVEYADLVARPLDVLRDVCRFCNVQRFTPDLERIENVCAEAKDEAWGLKNLHTIRPHLSRQSVDPRDLLPAAAVEWLAQFNVAQGVAA